MILAAGYGSRLGTRTQDTPKALIPVAGTPLLGRLLQTLQDSGVDSVVINLHHFPEQIRDYCSAHDNFGLNLQFSQEDGEPLGTGGGLKFAEKYFHADDDILVYNVDILSDISIRDMLKKHRANGADITLAVRERDSSRQLMFNGRKTLVGWCNTETGRRILIPGAGRNHLNFAFSGIHICKAEGLSGFPDAKSPYSLTDIWLQLAPSLKIQAYIHNDGYWFDCGKPNTLQEAETFLHRSHR